MKIGGCFVKKIIKSSLQNICFYSFTDVAIKDLMSYYRDIFKNQTITPKLHMLEEHVIPFLRKWHAPFGLYGEQGLESLHASMNKLMASFASMPNPVEKMKSYMKEHYTRVNPNLKETYTHLFDPKSRKNKKSEE